MSNQKQGDLSTEEIEKMRSLVARHDKENKAVTFDLNKPEQTPGIIPHYSHREFPRLMYMAGKKPREAHNQKEVTEAIRNGWSKDPVEEQDKPEKNELEKLREENARLNKELDTATDPETKSDPEPETGKDKGKK